MIDDLGFCYHCLTEDGKEVLAVTTLRGTALCEKCGQEYSDHEAEMDDRVAAQQDQS
jgi:hypothetical protein